MVQLLLIVGSSIFVLFGAAHGVFTLQDLSNPRHFTPRDSELRTAMQQSAIAFHPKINLWQAWLGFNLSHSLGLVMFGGAFLYVGILVSASYLVISLKFWFSKPAIYTGIPMGCFALAAALSW